MIEQGEPVTSDTSQTKWRNLSWIAAGIVAALVVSVTMSFAPVGFKRLFIFFIVFGAAIGYLQGWLVEELAPSPGRWRLAACVAIALLGSVNLTWSSYQQFHSARADWAKENPQEWAAAKMLEKMTEDDPEIARQYREQVAAYDPRFIDYLAHRTSGIGKLPEMGSVAIWVIELILACIASVAMFRFRLDDVRRQKSQSQ